MKREEKCKLAIEKGFSYDKETGNVIGIRGNIIKAKDTKGYIRFSFSFNNSKYKLFGHQFAWYWVNKECVEQIDHINRIKTDNRISNLRSVTNQQNQWNKEIKSDSKGYTWNKLAKKWQVRLHYNGKNLHIGLFDNEKDARQAYLNAKSSYHIV